MYELKKCIMEDKFKTIREDFKQIWEGDENREKDFNIIDEQGYALFVEMSLVSNNPEPGSIGDRLNRYQSRFVRTREEAELQLEWHKKNIPFGKWRILKIDRHAITLLE